LVAQEGLICETIFSKYLKGIIIKEINKKMSIWKGEWTIDALNEFGKGCMIENCGIAITEVGDDYIKATMPVSEKTRQAYGILHGGASLVLAETIGSYAAILCVDREKEQCVGLEINGNHLRPVREGLVTATARPAHIGRKTQVWEIKIHNENNDLVCISRITMAVIPKTH
jgi:1,4-dihydroxy-2-naphthoyl-CoA hydrolase